MLTLPLEPTDDRADPAFRNLAECTAWLAQFQLTNLQLAHSRLFKQINELNRLPMRGADRLEILELLGETVSHLQEELSKKLIAKPLPLNAGELMIFQSIVQLWQSMATGYQRSLQSCLSGDKSLAKLGALLCQRCLHYCGLCVFEHLRASYEPAPTLWGQLHELYCYAEHQGIHQSEVPDVRKAHQTSCAASYIKTLLICYARPDQMSRWQLQQTDLWLATWKDALSLDAGYKPSRDDAQPLAVELPGSQGLQRLDGLRHHDEMRYLTLIPLSKLLRVKTILLQQGKTPLQAGLGEQKDSQACLALLAILLHRWCENKRSVIRRTRVLQATLCCNIENIFAQLSGSPFDAHPATKRTEIDRPENWQMENESIMGAHLTRADPDGQRLNCQQLISLCFGETRLLGSTAWVRVMISGKLRIGVKYLPGVPSPVRIRAYGINPSNAVAPGFMLPALPEISTPASLILPRDWFEPDRMIELTSGNGEVSVVRLGFNVERGIDYERVSYTTKPVASSQ